MAACNIEKGVYAAALTPLHPDLRCNDEVLVEHCLQLIQRGCKGVVLFGTTGEGPSFSVEEKTHTLKQVIARGLNPKKIILGNGSSCLQDTVDLALAAVENRCLACLIAPPCFFKNVSEEGVIAFYREVIKRVGKSDLQIILYHIPQYTGVPLTFSIVKTLCTEFPDVVVGIKESEGNLSLVKEILKEIPSCQVFVGKEKLLPLAVEYGASGGICGVANLWPEEVCSLYEKRISLVELQKITSVLENRPFIASCKALLSQGRHSAWDFVRPPLVSLSRKEKSEILSQCAQIPKASVPFDERRGIQ